MASVESGERALFQEWSLFVWTVHLQGHIGMGQ